MAVKQETATGVRADGTYIQPGVAGSVVELKPRYENFVGGHFVPPVRGEYMPNISPATGHPFTEVARSSQEDVELALDAAHGGQRRVGGDLVG